MARIVKEAWDPESDQKDNDWPEHSDENFARRSKIWRGNSVPERVSVRNRSCTAKWSSRAGCRTCGPFNVDEEIELA